MANDTFFADAKEVVKEIIPGHILLVAQRDCGDWKAGMYGLLQGGDEAIAIFDAPIIADPFGNEDGPEDEDAWTQAQQSQFYDFLGYEGRNRRRFCNMHPQNAWRFVNALIAAGYQPQVNGDPVIWFFNYAAEQVQKRSQ